MATEPLNIPEKHLKDVIHIIRTGLREIRAPFEVSESLRKWCDEEAEYLSGDPLFKEELSRATDMQGYYDTTHTLRLALIRLCRGPLDHPPPDMHLLGGYSAGDERAPWMSEAMLYVLFGKESARTILSRMREVLLLAGFTEDEVRHLT